MRVAAASPLGTSSSSAPPRRLIEMTPSFSSRLPIVTRSGTPIRSASAKRTPGERSRSSTMTANPADESSRSSVSANASAASPIGVIQTSGCDYLGFQRIDRLASPWPLKRLQRARLTLLTPLTQNRRVQPLTTQQRADLARPRTRINLTQNPQLVLRREPSPLRTLDQLRIRQPRRYAASRSVPLAYGSLHSTAGGTLLLQLQHRVLRSHPHGSLLPSTRASHTMLAERGHTESIQTSAALTHRIIHSSQGLHGRI